MMDVLLSFCYYITFFFIPIAFYALFLKNTNDKRFYNKRDWYYVIKYFFAKIAIKKYQKICKQSLNEISIKELENPKEIQAEISSDSHFIYAADQKGNSLSLRFTLRSGLVAEIFLCLRLENGSVYTFPGEKTPKLYSLPSWQWKTKNLHIEILEPFKTLRVTFNGLLSNANDDVEHVRFNFIWKAAGGPKFYPQDAATDFLSDILAQETWKDGDWIALLGDERGYEQFGCLHGTVRGDSFAEDLTLNLPSCRTRFWGTAEKLAVTRSLHLFLTGKDGTLISLWAKALKKKCQGLKYGTVITSNGTICPIADCDVKLDSLGENKTLPPAFTVHVTASKKVYKAVFHVNVKRAMEVKNDESRGYQLSNVPADCDLDVQQAKAVVEFWYSQRGAGAKLPSPLLVENKTKNLPACYVTRFRDEEAKMVRLVGGKGCSLALLSSLKCDDFTVPDGFIVTVNAFNKQLEDNFNIKKAVAILDDICCGRAKGNLERACAETVKTFKNERIHPDVVEQVRRHLDSTARWAVRSSAIGEDSEQLSAAGQNETVLGCTDVVSAISVCWASLFSYQSVLYRHQHGIPVASEMAVVVQRMVPAECAGVLFTCHPSTANPAQMVITANHGLGESVVSGRTEPDTVILDRTFDGDVAINSKTPGGKRTMVRMDDVKGVEEVDGAEGFCLGDNQALLLGRVGVRIEEAFGGCRDIEWAFHQGRLYLLQARPVTTLNAWTDDELLHEMDSPTLTEDAVYTIANAGEVYPGAITVLSNSTTVKATEWSMQLSVQGKIDPFADTRVPVFRHRMFIDVIGTIHRSVGEKVELSSKILDLAIFGHPIINEKIHSMALQKFGAAKKGQRFREMRDMISLAWNNENYVKSIKKLVSEYDFGIDETRDSLEDIYRKIDASLMKIAEALKYHMFTTRTSITYQMLAMNALAENSEDFTLDHYNDIALLLSSCNEVISAEIPNVLAEIADVVIKQGKAEEFRAIEPGRGRHWLEENCPEASKKFEQFLQEHGHRTLREFDLSSITWAADPSQVITMIQANCKKLGPKQQKVSRSIDDVIASLVSPKKNGTRRFLKFITRKGRNAVGAREQSKSECVRFIDKFRRAYKLLARKMALEGLLPDEELIVHLTHHEVALLIERNEHGPALITKAQRRRKLFPKWHAQKFPEMIYGIPEPEVETECVIRTGNSKVKCEGTPVCVGVVKARACVITDLAEIDQLQDGDILITFCTDIGWSPYFPMLAGIVTELGGLVSHGAVVAREYGLPSIVGAKGATKMFKTGDIVVLSGKTGTIELFQ